MARNTKINRAMDVTVILAVFATFFVLAAYYDFLRDQFRIRGLVISLAFVLATAIAAAVFLMELRLRFKRPAAKQWLIENKAPLFGGLAVAAVVLVPRLFQLHVPLFWDSAFYWHGLQLAAEFNFSFSDLMHYAAIGYHPSQAYSIFLLIGYYLDPYGTTGVNAIRVLMSIIEGVFLYRIILKIVPKARPSMAALGAALVVSSPLYLGVFGTLNLDWPLHIFTVYTIYFILFNHEILYIASALCLVFSKEPGVILLFGIIGGMLLAKHGKKHNDDAIKVGSFVLIAPLALSAGIYAFSRLYVQSWDPSAANVSYYDYIIEHLTIETTIDLTKYFIFRFITCFLINFNWLYWMLTACLAIILTKGRLFTAGIWKNYPLCHHITLVIMVCVILFGAFSILYVTLNNPRYSMPLELFASTLCAIFLALASTSGHAKYMTVAATALVIISMVQAYTSIDPISRLLGVGIPSGREGVEVYAPQKANRFYGSNRIENPIVFTNGGPDMAVYNGQLLSRGELIDEILNEAGYDGTQGVLAYNNSQVVDVTLSVTGGTIIDDGNGGRIDLGLNWDIAEGRRTLRKEDGNSIVDLKCWDADEFRSLASEGDSLPSTIILIGDPFSQRNFDGSNVDSYAGFENAMDDILLYLGQWYVAGEPNWVSIPMQSEMCFYILEKK